MKAMLGNRNSRLRASLAKWFGWLLAIMLVSMLVGAARFVPLAPADRAFTIPAHATSGLLTLAVAIVTLALRRRVPTGADRRSYEAGAWIGRQDGAAKAVILLTILQTLLGLASTAVSPIAIRILYSGFDLGSLAPANQGFFAMLQTLHGINAALLCAAIAAYLGVVAWRQFVIGDGALVRLMPFAGLWTRLKAEEQWRRDRTPSLRANGWATGNLT